MATTINASTSGLIETSDGTAVLALQTGGTTAVTVNATQAIGVGSSPSYGSAGQFLTSQGSGASPTWTTGGTGTVTSVGWTGGIVSVATATTTPAFTIAGTSGGIPYFSSASTWASSGALTQYGVVYGGGAGGAPVATAAGTTGQFLGANTGGAPTWQTPSGGGSPGGSPTQVQYNNGGAFGGISGFTTDGTRVTASTTIGVGGATPSTSGNGITFPATASMSSNANTLSDYEYGTFTANLGGTETGTFTCNYSKIGNLVTIYGAIAVTAINTGSTTVVSGLPYTINGNGFASFACSYWDNIATAVVFIGALGTNAGTSLTLYSATAATSSGLTANAIFKNSATIRFVGSYITTQA